MRQSGLRRITAIVVICALVGAVAGIAGSAAAPSGSNQDSAAEKRAAAKNAAAKRAAQRRARAERRGLRMGPRLHRGGPALHSEAVVPNEDGDGFITVTMDAGALKSVDGTTVHIRQAIGNAVYKEDAAIDVGSDAKVFRNHEEAKLSDLKEGDRVHVIRSPEGNVVMAHDKDWMPRRFGRRHHGPGPGPGGPPPGMMPAPEGGSGNQNGSGTGEYPGGGTNS